MSQIMNGPKRVPIEPGYATILLVDRPNGSVVDLHLQTIHARHIKDAARLSLEDLLKTDLVDEFPQGRDRVHLFTVRMEVWRWDY